jgi:uncharacterized protein (TIGR00369 family)
MSMPSPPPGPVPPAAALPVTIEQVNGFITAELPFTTLLGITCEGLAAGESLLRWRHHRGWIRPGGEEEFVCGPVMMAMADVGIYTAIFTVAGITPLALTNELKMTFLRPAFGGDLLCRTRLVKSGRRLAYGVGDIFIEGDEARLVAQSTSTYVMPD